MALVYGAEQCLLLLDGNSTSGIEVSGLKNNQNNLNTKINLKNNNNSNSSSDSSDINNNNNQSNKDCRDDKIDNRDVWIFPSYLSKDFLNNKDISGWDCSSIFVSLLFFMFLFAFSCFIIYIHLYLTCCLLIYLFPLFFLISLFLSYIHLIPSFEPFPFPMILFADSYVSPICKVLQSIILSEVQKKELEAISQIILYTFSKDLNRESTGNDIDANDSSSASSSNRTDNNNSRSINKDNSNSNNYKNSRSNKVVSHPIVVLRTSLLRLLSCTYEEHTNNLLKVSKTRRGSTDRSRSRSSENNSEVSRFSYDYETSVFICICANM